MFVMIRVVLPGSRSYVVILCVIRIYQGKLE
jgi:hypothetical protein